MFTAVFIAHRGWRIQRDGFDICGAVSEAVAKETALAMNEFRRSNP